MSRPSSDRASGRELAARHFSGAACDACREVHPEEELDENRWCEGCRERIRRQLRIGQHVIAAVIVFPFAIWVWTLEKVEYLPLYAWFLPLAAAYYLGLRIGRESIKGYVRWRRVR